MTKNSILRMGKFKIYSDCFFAEFPCLEDKKKHNHFKNISIIYFPNFIQWGNSNTNKHVNQLLQSTVSTR